MSKVQTDVYTFKDDVGKTYIERQHTIHLKLNKMYWQKTQMRQTKSF